IIVGDRKKHQQKTSTKTLETNSTKLDIPKPWIILLSIVFLMISLFLINRIGGLSSLFSSRTEINQVFNDTYSKTNLLIFGNLQKVPLFVILVLCITQIKNGGKKLLLLGIVLIVINLIISNPLSNSRYWFGSVILSLGFIILKWKNNSFSFWTITIITLLLIIFPYSDIFRVTTEFNGIEIESIATQITQNGDYDAFQMLMNTIKFVDTYGLTYGMQFLGAIFFFVPRSIWPDKPLSSAQLVGEGLGYRFTNLSEPLWAEAYLNMGVIGIIVGFFLYGLMTSYLQRKFMESISDNTVTFFRILVPFFAAYQPFLMRGDLMNGISYLASFIFFSFVFVKFKPKKREEIAAKDVRTRRIFIR
ncbi:oligosaccharide repeat unit polymerase, partial [Paenibacillus sp. Marseille-Q4541]|uniref:oligosaccharide repeat unit polymerase n=1 Tax=Paenibacillus sp. Marseille-Q4541 TaxID=2831522 RepID=UPI001BAC19A3